MDNFFQFASYNSEQNRGKLINITTIRIFDYIGYEKGLEISRVRNLIDSAFFVFFLNFDIARINKPCYIKNLNFFELNSPIKQSLSEFGELLDIRVKSFDLISCLLKEDKSHQLRSISKVKSRIGYHGYYAHNLLTSKRSLKMTLCQNTFGY